MNELLDILKKMNIVLPDEKMNAEELLWWIIGYKACIDQVEFIISMLNEKQQSTAEVMMGDAYEVIET